MDGIREYILSVCAAAVLCGLLRGILGEKGPVAGLMKMLCGIFLAFTVISPVTRVQIRDLTGFLETISADGTAVAQSGVKEAGNAMGDIIKAETEAYILDKAKSLELELEVVVALSEDAIPVPETVWISGETSPYTKLQLQSIIAEELGIQKENQIWMD